LSLFVLISLSCVSAADDNQTDINAQVFDVKVEETLTDVSTDEGNFTTLNELISQSENELTLDKNYKFNPSTDKDIDGFTIAKDNYVVDGKGHTIDGSNQVRIFIFTGSNITLKNLNIINANGTNGPAAYFASLAMIDNCSFINNTATNQGGAIYINNSISNCKINSTFINNSAYQGGAIFFNGETDNNKIAGYFDGNEAERIGGALCFQAKASNNIISAKFNNNRANSASGGAIFFRDLADGNQFEGIFTANYANQGGAIFFYNKANNNRFNSDFKSNMANTSGGAIVFFGTTDGNNFTGSFINNSAWGISSDDSVGNGGAITFTNISSNCVFACDFINNTAAKHGGAINYRQTPQGIAFNGNFINNKASYGAGINFFESMENVVFNGEFNGNTAYQGGAIFINNSVSNCKINSTFINNSAYQGGAIFFNNETDNVIINGYFDGNEAERIGGALCFQAKASNNIISAEFYNNKANSASGGAIFFRNLAEGNQFESVFRGNNAVYGGAIFFYDKANNNRFNSNFDSNVANSTGGAIVFVNTTDNNNFTGLFVNNAALGEGSGDLNGNGGAMTFRDVSSNCVFTCDFINNTATNNGGGVNYRQNPYNITFNGNLINVTINGVDIVSVNDNATLTLINAVPAQLKNINVSNITYGETVKISSDVVDENNVPLNNGTLSVIINGKTYSADVSNGTATIKISNLNAGNYNVDVKYLGNGRVFISSVAFSVSKQGAAISAKNKAYIINYGEKYSIILKDAKGKAIAGKKVSFKLNGKNIGSAKTNAKGVATISLTAKILKAQKAGTKKLVIKFADSNYNTVSKTVKITINKEKTKIVAKNKVFKKAKKVKKYTITLKNSKNKAVKKVLVTLKVKGKLYKAKTNSKGKATFNLKKLTKTGKFTAAIRFKGNTLYKPTLKKVKITVKK